MYFFSVRLDVRDGVVQGMVGTRVAEYVRHR